METSWEVYISEKSLKKICKMLEFLKLYSDTFIELEQTGMLFIGLNVEINKIHFSPC